jgi:hypothetical protein
MVHAKENSAMIKAPDTPLKAVVRVAKLWQKITQEISAEVKSAASSEDVLLAVVEATSRFSDQLASELARCVEEAKEDDHSMNQLRD